MKTLLSIALFTAILHADATPEMPDASQQQTPAQTTPNSSQPQPTQEMPASPTKMGDTAPPLPDPSQQTPSATQQKPNLNPEMGDVVPPLPDPSQQKPNSTQETKTDLEMGDAAPAMTAPVTAEPMQQEEMICEPLYGDYILAEFKLGYFRFGDRTLRHIYSDGVLDVQLTSSFRVWKPLYIYAAIEYIGAKGRTLGGHERTKIRLVPLSLGLQYIQKITFDLKYYLTVGPRLFHFHQKNHSEGVPSTVNKWGCGGFINTGFMYYLSEHIIIDFFGEYSYKRMHFKTERKNVEGNSLQIGGLTLGAGLGYFW